MLQANEETVGDINAPNVFIKVIKRNGRKKITTIVGLFSTQMNSLLPPYIDEQYQKALASTLSKLCAARASLVDSRKAVGKKGKIDEDDPSDGEMVIQIQGANTDRIIEYLTSIGIPNEKIKLSGLTDE